MIEKVYIKGYKNRPSLLLFGITLLFITFVIFTVNKKALSVYSAQTNLLCRSSFKYGYVLNYHLGLDNEYAFPDTDIVLFKDELGNNTMPISCYMQLSDTWYNEFDLLQGISSKLIASNEIVLSKNTLRENGLECGDKIWASFPNKKELKELFVVSSEEDGYDLFTNNILGVGLGVIGNDKEFLQNISCKYIVFSVNPLSDIFVQQPQALKSTFTKGELLFRATKQLLLFGILIITMIVVGEILYMLITKTSMDILDVMIRKGYEKRKAIILLLIEFLFYFFFPMVLGIIIFSIIFIKGIAKIIICETMCMMVVISSVPLYFSRLLKYRVKK